MLTKQPIRRSLHRSAVERPKAPANFSCFDTGAHWRFKQAVTIAPRGGATARVERGRHRLRPLHRNVSRQIAIGTAHPGIGGALQVSVDMHHLHQRMYAGISTASAAGGHRCTCELCLCRFEPVLHGAAAALALPALISLAAVADAERDPLAALCAVLNRCRVRFQSIDAKKRCALAFSVPDDSPITS